MHPIANQTRGEDRLPKVLMVWYNHGAETERFQKAPVAALLSAPFTVTTHQLEESVESPTSCKDQSMKPKNVAMMMGLQISSLKCL